MSDNASGWQQRIAALEQELAALRRENSVALCQSCTRLREIARDSELMGTIVYDLKGGETRFIRSEGQNAKDALPPAPEGSPAKETAAEDWQRERWSRTSSSAVDSEVQE